VLTLPKILLPRCSPSADLVDLAAYKAKGKTAGQAPNSDGAPGRIRTCAPASGGRFRGR
jgi:hypothetical protein